MCCEKRKCERPEELKGNPRECSSEQIKECHGDMEVHPCVETESCEHPAKLNGKPGECSPARIRECHGDSAGHSCEARS